MTSTTEVNDDNDAVIEIVTGGVFEERFVNGPQVSLSKRRVQAWRDYQTALQHDALWTLTYAPSGCVVPGAPSIDE